MKFLFLDKIGVIKQSFEKLINDFELKDGVSIELIGEGKVVGCIDLQKARFNKIVIE